MVAPPRPRETMGTDQDQPRQPDIAHRFVIPTGRLGFRGRQATPEERAHLLDAFFFEGTRRRPYLQQFLALMLLAGTIAAFGLIADSGAVVIGAMLVAPLMTPILATAAALVQGWTRRAAESMLIVGGGAALAIGIGILIAWLEPQVGEPFPLPGELLARTGPRLVDLGIAIAAGAAGAFVTVRTEASSALPGVGIAVALVPPLVAVGVTLGLGERELAGGALLLFATNLVAIILSAALVFTLAGFAAFMDPAGRSGTRRGLIVVAVMAVMVMVSLGGRSYQLLQDNRDVASAARAVHDWAPALKLETIELHHHAERTLVDVSITGTELPPPAWDLAEALSQELDRHVVLEVAFVPVDRAEGERP